MNTFTKEITIENKILQIRVSCELRSHIGIPKQIFVEDINNLIPESLKNNIEMISAPSLRISNINSAEFSNFGVWTFKILEPNVVEKSPQKSKTRRSRTQRKKT